MQKFQAKQAVVVVLFKGRPVEMKKTSEEGGGVGMAGSLSKNVDRIG